MHSQVGVGQVALQVYPWELDNGIADLMPIIEYR